MIPEKVKDRLPENLVFLGYRGSQAHGTYVPNSHPESIDDIDLMGVFIAPIAHYLGFGRKEVIESFPDEYDTVCYEFRKFIHLLIKNNPNVLSMLWLEKESILHRTQVWDYLVKNRNLFVSKLAYHSFTGYAYAQLKKMTAFGQHQQFQFQQTEQNLIDLDIKVIDGVPKLPPGATSQQMEAVRQYNEVKQKYFSGYMGEKRKNNVLKFGYDCYDAKTTEFLTTDGWKFFDQITNQSLATVNPINRRIEFQQPRVRIDKEYSGKMYLFEPYGSRAFVTPQHNMFLSPCHRSQVNSFSTSYSEEDSNWSLKALESILSGTRSHFHYSTTGHVRTSSNIKVDNNYLLLAGCYLSEGCAQFREDGTFKCIKMTQTKNGSFVTIMDRLRNFYPIWKGVYPKETVWILHGETAKQIYDEFGHKKDKHLPNWCFQLSSTQVTALWTGLVAGDGTEKLANTVYYTSVKKLGDDIHAMLVSAGFPSVMYGPYTSHTSYGTVDMYHIVRSNFSSNIRSTDLHKILRVGEIVTDKEGFPVKEVYVENQRVVCFEVPNGTLITRNNGKPAVQGNCKNAAHLIRLLTMCVEFLETGKFTVKRPDATTLLLIKQGHMSLENIKSWAEELFSQAKTLFEKSWFPEQPHKDKIEKMLIDILEVHFYPMQIGC